MENLFRIQSWTLSLSLLSHSYLFPRTTVNNIPTMKSCTGISGIIRSKDYSLTGYTWEVRNNASRHTTFKNAILFEHTHIANEIKMLCCFYQTKFYALHRQYIQFFLDSLMMLHSNVVWQTIFNEIYCFIFSVGRYHLKINWKRASVSN